jgi:hypothetical protein
MWTYPTMICRPPLRRMWTYPTMICRPPLRRMWTHPTMICRPPLKDQSFVAVGAPRIRPKRAILFAIVDVVWDADGTRRSQSVASDAATLPQVTPRRTRSCPINFQAHWFLAYFNLLCKERHSTILNATRIRFGWRRFRQSCQFDTRIVPAGEPISQ